MPATKSGAREHTKRQQRQQLRRMIPPPPHMVCVTDSISMTSSCSHGSNRRDRPTPRPAAPVVWGPHTPLAVAVTVVFRDRPWRIQMKLKMHISMGVERPIDRAETAQPCARGMGFKSIIPAQQHQAQSSGRAPAKTKCEKPVQIGVRETSAAPATAAAAAAHRLPSGSPAGADMFAASPSAESAGSARRPPSAVLDHRLRFLNLHSLGGSKQPNLPSL
uniref:Uncharacterized protein n=1 Tax=Anopheles albimanus TaxID=7167 RepID=A0A182F7J2_ANOAL